MHMWDFYQMGEKDFSDCLIPQFILSASPFVPLCSSCSGWQHVGSGDRPVPHAGGVHHVLLVWGELRSERGPGTLQRLHAASRRSSPERRDLSRFILSPFCWCFFFFFLNSTYNEEILNVSIQLMCFKRARTWTLFEPHPRWHEATCRLPTSDPHRGLHSCIIVCFSCELNTTTPKFSRRLDCIQC